jgi:NB-ARC domain
MATFTGREELLGEIRSRLTGGGPVVVAALHGMGGVGKTQLAVEYAWRHASDYTLVWWVDAEHVAVLTEQVAALVARLGLPATGSVTDDAAAVLDALRRHRSWLLIFDNAEDPAMLRPWLPGGTGHVLITSRTPTWAALATSVDVDVLSTGEAVHFLQAGSAAAPARPGPRLDPTLRPSSTTSRPPY